MKKLFIASVLIFFFSFNSNVVNANEYATYQEITFDNQGAKLLEDYSKKLYEEDYARIKKRRFWGWRMFTHYETEELSFIKETMYVIVNEGDTAITETFKFKNTESVKKQYDVSGDIGIHVNGVVKGFKLGLEEEMDFAISATTNSTYTEEVEIKVNVDPYTKLTVQICGEGKVSNGVAKYYRFWRNVKKGGWEVFIVTTEYYSITKERIDEV